MEICNCQNSGDFGLSGEKHSPQLGPSPLYVPSTYMMQDHQGLPNGKIGWKVTAGQAVRFD